MRGSVHAPPGLASGAALDLSLRTLPAFSGFLELLLRTGVTTVAEAASQDRLNNRPGLGQIVNFLNGPSTALN